MTRPRKPSPLQHGHDVHVTPQDGKSLVRISTTWEGAGGIGGLFERLFAPRVMRGMYADEPERLDAYARAHRDT